MGRSGALHAAAIAAASFALDRLAKWWVVEALDLRTLGAIDVSPILNFRMGWNRGINFGVFGAGGETQAAILIGVAVAVSLGLLIWAARRPRRDVAVAAGLIAGGALGNAWDRFTEGAVVDFLNVSCCGIRNPYVFNTADIAIFAGVAVILIWGERKRPPAGA